jgi:hypothetical protein
MNYGNLATRDEIQALLVKLEVKIEVDARASQTQFFGLVFAVWTAVLAVLKATVQTG